MDLSILSQEFCQHSSLILGYSPATIARYRIGIQLLQRQVGITRIDECTEPKVRDFFYRGRRDRGWSASTYATYHKSLRVFFRWCVDKKHLPANPTDGIEVPKGAKALPRRLSLQDARRVLEFVENAPYPYEFQRWRNLAILATFMHAGLRRQELLGLQVGDVDLEGGTILVRRGKGAKDRTVPMGPTLPGILQRYADDRKRLRKACPQFFASLNRDKGLTLEGLRRVLESIRKATGLDITPHKLRHTFATLMLEGGSNIFAISQMMGHSDIKTTTIYLAATPEHLREQMAKHPLNYPGRMGPS